MKQLRYGIIGCGLIAHWHARALLALAEGEGVALFGVGDAHPPAAERFAAKYGIRAYKSVAELLSDPQIDIVSICTPSGTHCELVVAAAQRGKHIAVEKPMAITQEQLDRIVAVCDRTGVKLTSISQLRFSGSINRAKEAVRGGLLGRMLCGDVYMKYHRAKEYYADSSWKGTMRMDGGGALMNQGIHGVDVLQYIMGPVRSVNACVRTLSHQIEAEDTAAAVLEYQSGALGVIQATTAVYPGYEKILAFHGDKGSIKMEETSFIQWRTVQGGPPEDIKLIVPGQAVNTPDSIDLNGHIAQIRDLIRAVREDRQPAVHPGEGRKPVDIILAIYESSRRKEAVMLEEYLAGHK